MARIVSACLQQLRGCPAPLLESADNCHPAALRQRLPGVAGLGCLDEPEVPGVLVVEAARHPAPSSSQSCSNCRMSAPFRLPGWAVCPALGTRGTVDAVACQQATRGKRQSRRSRPSIRTAEWARFWCRVGWWSACGWGSGMPAPSGQIPPPWAWSESEAPRHEGRLSARPRPLAMRLARSRCPVALCARVLSGSPRTRRAHHGSSGARQNR